MNGFNDLWEESQEIVLKKMKFGLKTHLSLEMLPDINIKSFMDEFTKSIVFQFQTQILGQKIDLIHYPKNWKESFKERWFPQWLLKKYPVQYEIIEIKALYPQLLIPDQTAIFHVMKRGEE